MKRLPIVFLTLMLLAGIFSVNPTNAGATASTQRRVTCDGTLTLAEVTALNAFPALQVTRAMICDVKPEDLPRLTPALRTRFTAVAYRYSTDAGVTTSAESATGWRRSVHEHRWRFENSFHQAIMRFEHRIWWSWNRDNVSLVNVETEGHGSRWGYIYCGANRSSVWGPNRDWKRLRAVGDFAAIWPAGCAVVINSMGASHTVWRHGTIRMHDQTCSIGCIATSCIGLCGESTRREGE